MALRGTSRVGELMAETLTGGTTLFVCTTCRAQGAEPSSNEQPRAGARLLQALQAIGDERISVQPVECLSNCNRSCTVAVTAPGKWTYVLGALDPETHASDVLTFAALHQQHEAGLPPWRERPEYLRKNTIARVPPLPRSSDKVPLP